MTAQQLFNKMGNHLLTQGRKSMGPSGYCAYRGQGNTCCAVGILITDEEYTDEFEQKSSDAVIGYPDAEHLKGLSITRLLPFRELLRDMQRAHDDIQNDTYFHEDISRAMQYVAKDHKLSLRWVKNHKEWIEPND